MKVRVIGKGFWQPVGEPGRRPRLGEILNISDAKFSKGHKREGQVIAFNPMWMEAVDAKAVKKEVKPKDEPVAEAVGESEEI